MDKEQLYIRIKKYDEMILKSQKLWEEINKMKPEEMNFLDFQDLIKQARLDNDLIDKFYAEEPLNCKSLIYRGANKEYLYQCVSSINNNLLTEIQQKLLDDLHNKKREKNFPYTYDRKILDLREISKEEYDRLLNKMDNKEQFSYDELDYFLLNDSKRFIAVDNGTGKMWTEEFKEREKAVRYLQGESIDKLRDEECKYEICIYETEQDYNEGEPFQLDVYSNLEDAKAELRNVIKFNDYFSGKIVNQENGIEEYSHYLNNEIERYRYVFECTLEISSKKYEHQYLLVKEPNDLETNMEIDLTGGFAFNCDYKVTNPMLVQIVNTIKELEEFCQAHNIKIPKECITRDGIIASGPNGLLINNNLESIDWIENIEEDEETYE